MTYWYFMPICRTHWNCKMANETIGRLTIYRQTVSFAEPANKVALLRCIRVFTAVEKTKQSLVFPGIGWGLESGKTQIILIGPRFFSCFEGGMGCQHCKILFWFIKFLKDHAAIVFGLVCCCYTNYLSMPITPSRSPQRPAHGWRYYDIRMQLKYQLRIPIMDSRGRGDTGDDEDSLDVCKTLRSP